MNVAVIVQARMGSTRLPGKTMMDLDGRPVVWHVFDRVKQSKLINQILLATTTNSEDDILESWAKENNVNCFRGSVDDVLDRYYQAALILQAEVVVRVTGDCPLIDAEVIDRVIKYYLDNKFDYCSNINPATFPDGLDVEVFSFVALEKAWKEATLKSEREHVTPFIWKQPDLFKIGLVKNEVDFSGDRWTLDTANDFEFIKLIMGEIKNRQLKGNMQEVLAILADNPEWTSINNNSQRNEGYAKSIKEDGNI